MMFPVGSEVHVIYPTYDIEFDAIVRFTPEDNEFRSYGVECTENRKVGVLHNLQGRLSRNKGLWVRLEHMTLLNKELKYDPLQMVDDEEDL